MTNLFGNWIKLFWWQKLWREGIYGKWSYHRRGYVLSALTTIMVALKKADLYATLNGERWPRIICRKGTPWSRVGYISGRTLLTTHQARLKLMKQMWGQGCQVELMSNCGVKPCAMPEKNSQTKFSIPGYRSVATAYVYHSCHTTDNEPRAG
jgi:hypothetical protein